MRSGIRCNWALAAIALSSVATADVQKGMDAYDIGDYETAMAECLPAAEAGDATGQFCVGRMYANGFGVAMDDALALQWYGQAADQNHAEALYNLGVMHENGWGVEMNDAAAADLFTRAAELGSVMAQMSLANLHRQGRGVDQDFAKAYMWYAVADLRGQMNAGFKLDELAVELSAEERELAEANAQQWFDANIGDEMNVNVID